MTIDATVLIYIAILVVAIYGTCLFTWWWVKNRRASSVFVYVTFVFVGEAIETGIALWSRMLGMYYSAEHKDAFQAIFLWPGRKIVILGALTALVVHMTVRLIREKRWETSNPLPKGHSERAAAMDRRNDGAERLDTKGKRK